MLKFISSYTISKKSNIKVLFSQPPKARLPSQIQLAAYFLYSPQAENYFMFKWLGEKIKINILYMWKLLKFKFQCSYIKLYWNMNIFLNFNLTKNIVH